jgi:hypothetical protein
MTNARNNPAELLPCPFCGGSASYAKREIDNILYERIICNNDDCSCYVECEEDYGLIKRWNTRATDSSDLEHARTAAFAAGISAGNESIRANKLKRQLQSAIELIDRLEEGIINAELALREAEDKFWGKSDEMQVAQKPLIALKAEIQQFRKGG